MQNFQRLRERCNRIVAAILSEDAPAEETRGARDERNRRAIVVTGGDTAHGEVLRGDVLLIHYDEATANPDYAYEMLGEACFWNAPDVVIDSLREILREQHGRLA